MMRIVFEPLPMELRLHRDQYEALAASLREDGFEVQITPPTEERGAGPDIVHAAYDVVIWVYEHPGDAAALGALAKTIVDFLKKQVGKRRRRRRTAVIYGSNGEVMHTFKIEEAD
jgi:hypothetical protein